MKNLFIGIDFAAKKFDVAVIYAEGLQEQAPAEYNQFENTDEGFKAFVSWVKKNSHKTKAQDWLFCGEDTGDYCRRLCNFLCRKEYDMWLENPKCIKDSGGLRRAKSDKMDARAIAEYAMRNYDRARLYKEPPKILSDLRELFQYRQWLVRDKVANTLRWKIKKENLEKSSATGFVVRKNQETIKHYEKQIKQVDDKIQKLIKSDEKLLATYKILKSVKGIGPVNICCLIVYTENFTKYDYDPRKIACQCGIAPFGQESGTSVHVSPHVHYMANKTIKALLTQAALAAVRFNPLISRYYNRLIDAGKIHPVALNNVKNKLIHIMTAMVKNGTEFDENYEAKRKTRTALNAESSTVSTNGKGIYTPAEQPTDAVSQLPEQPIDEAFHEASQLPELPADGASQLPEDSNQDTQMHIDFPQESMATGHAHIPLKGSESCRPIEKSHIPI